MVFLTPVLVYAARSRGQGEGSLLIGCLLLSNAGSLLLPGSNLTNLIVLGHLHLSGGQFFGQDVPPLAGLGARHRYGHRPCRAPLADLPDRGYGRSRGGIDGRSRAGRGAVQGLTLGLGVVAVAVVTVLVLVLQSPALPVAGVGVVVVAAGLTSGRMGPTEIRRVVGVPVLIGLFGIAVALGALGRAWSGPATLLSHLDAVGTAAVAAVSTVLVNNLPAAALLASRVPPHPYALLVGLDIGPNLFVTGSLAWILWIRTSRSSGADPPVARTVGLGLVTVPLAIAAASGHAGRHRPLVIIPAPPVSAPVGPRAASAGRSAQEAGQLIFRRSTTKTRVSLAAMPAPGDWAP